MFMKFYVSKQSYNFPILILLVKKLPILNRKNIVTKRNCEFL